MSELQKQPDTLPSGNQLVTDQEEKLILKSLTLPHGIGVDYGRAATVEGYDTVKGQGATTARPDWSSEYSQSMRTLIDATRNQPPAVLHAADYVLEQVAKAANYDEQRIIQARQQLAQDINDGIFAKKVEAARHTVESAVELQLSQER